MIPRHWQAVARTDGETVGYVEPTDDELVARDLLGIELGRAGSHDGAAALVVERGLASLGRSWEWTDGSGQTRRVYVVQVRPGAATVSTGHPNVVGAPGERFDVELPVDPATFRPL
jgi:hypothetical protein